jgi:hypothetical protein
MWDRIRSPLMPGDGSTDVNLSHEVEIKKYPN